MKLKKSIVLVLVFSLIITTGIITFAKDYADADETGFSDSESLAQYSNTYSPIVPKKYVPQVNVVEGKKDKSTASRTAKGPADSPPQQDGRTISYGDTVSGEITEQGAQDEWIFEGASGDLIVINMDSDDFDTFLELQYNGERVSSNDDYNGLNSQMGPMALPQDGQYTIIARPLSETASGAYTLSLATVSVETLTYGETINGEITSADRVLWAIEATAGDIIILRMSAADFTPNIEVRNALGEWVNGSDDFVEHEAVLGPFSLQEDGLYFVSINGFSFPDDMPYAYELSVERVEVEELNGGSLVYGDSISTTISNGDTHAWTFDGQSGDLIVVSVNGANIFPSVALTRPDGSILVDESFGIYNDGIGPLVLPLNGTYTVNVTGYSDGIYTISLEQQGTATPGTGGGTLVYDEAQTATYGQGAPETWTFDGNEGDVITIQASSDSLTLNLTLLDSNGSFIANDYPTFDEDAQLGPFVLPQTDTYTLAISSYDISISGEYSVSIESGELGDAGGGAITYDETQSATLIGGIEDMWTFDGREGDVILIRMSSDDFDTFLALQDESGTQLASNDDFNALNSQIGPYTLPADGTYTIIARGLSEYVAGDYELSLDMPTFSTIAYGETQSSELGVGDIQFWTFEATATDIIRATVVTDSFEPTLRLSNEAGVELDATFAFDEPTLDATIAETGTYTITVMSDNSESTGPYDITLEVRGRVELGDGILEYGDSEAGLLSVGARDEWTFEASENDVVTITLNSDDFDTYLELIGPDGTEIDRNDDFDGLNSQLGPRVLTQSGTYTIIARGYSDTGSGAYTITLESSGTAEPGGGELGYGDSVEGVAIAGVQDRWTFDGEAEDLIIITMASDDFDTYLELLDSSGESIASNDDFNGLNSQLGPMLLTESGTYTIIARPLSSSSGGMYSLSLSLTELQALEFGETQGTLQSGETAIYALNVNTDDIVGITLTSDDFTPRIEVRDAGNNWLYGEDDYEESGLVRVGPFTAEETGQLTIVVQSVYSGSGDFAINVEHVELTDIAGGELSFGDTLATTLQTNERHQWTFEGLRGDLVRINMDSNDFDTFLELNGPDGNSILTNDDFNGLNSQLGPLVLSVDGTYTIIARPLSDGNSGVYTISLIKEGTGTPGTGGGTLQYDETVEGVYATGTPERWTFEGREGDAITIRAELEEYSASLELYQDSDTFLTSSSNFDYDTNTVELGPIVLPASTSFDVVLTTYDSTESTDYSLSVEFMGRPEAGGGEITLGEPISNTLYGGLQDVWTFEGTAGDTVMAVLSDNAVYPNIELQDASGQFLQGLNYNYGSNSQIGPYSLPDDGTYQIVVGTDGDYTSGDYTLTLSLVEFQDIAYGESLNGELVAGAPQFWHFDATATDIVNIVASSDNFTAQVVLLDSDGNNLQYADSVNGDASLSLTIAETDTYTIAVYTYDMVESGEYTLSLTIDGRAELGDGELGYGDTESGLLGQGARDEWIFEGSGGDTIVVVMESDNFDTYLELFDSNGEELTRNDDFDGLNSQIGPYTLPADDTYTIIARGFSETGTGIYSVSVDIFEATEISFGETVENTLDVDSNAIYTLEVESGEIIVLTAQSGDFYVSVQVRDTDNFYLTESTSYSTDEPATIGPMVLNDGGIYVIVISSSNDNEGGDYTLSIERGEPVESGGHLETPSATGTLIAGARDEWTFDGVEGSTITIAMNSDDFDTYLELYDSNGEEIARNDDFDDLNSQIGPLELTATDTYTVIARGYSNSGAGTYTISLSIEGDTVAVDDDGTDSTPQTGGGSLVYGDSVVAELSTNASDEWTFEGAAGDIVTISLESEDFDPVLELYDTSNSQIARNDDFEGSFNARIDAFELPDDGLYTILARAFGNSASGEYTISLTSDAPIVTEPDTDVPDTVDTSDFVAGDGILLYGESETGELVAGAQDVYTFDATGGDVVTILVNSDDFDTWAELRRSAGSLISYNNDGDGTNSVIVGAELPTDNTYQIIVKGASGDDAGPYTVTLLLDDGTVVADSDPTDDGNDDDTLLAIGDSVTAELEEGARDEWTFRSRSGTVVTISLSSDDFDTVLELQGPNGRELTRNDDSGGETNSQIGPYVLPSTGTYTVIARAFNQTASGEYTLSIEESVILSGGQIELNETQTGEMRSGDPQEWTFDGQTGDIVQINLDSDDFDTYLELELEDGTLLFSNDDYNGLNSQIGPYRLPATGTFVIVVSSYSSTGTGSYTLSLQEVMTTEIAYGDVLDGDLSEGESVLYEFEGAEGDIVIISAQSTQLETVLQLNQSGNAIATEFDEGSGAQIGPMMLPLDGVYTVTVSSYNPSDSGNYTISLEPFADSAVLGGVIEYGQPITEFLVGGTQSRWEFDGTAGDSVIISMNSEDFDTYLILEDADGIELTYNDDFNGLNSQIGPYTLPDTGTYTIVAFGFREAEYGEYTLNLTLQNFLGDVAYNQNYSSTLTDDTADYWTLEVSGGDILAFSVESEAFAPILEVRDSSNFLIYSDFNTDGGNAQIGPITIDFSDQFTLIISSSDSTGGDYTLLVEEQEIVTGGGSLNLDDSTVAELESGIESRWKFEAQAGETVTIVMNSPDFDTVLELVDVDGNEVAFNDDYQDLNSQIGPLSLPYTGTYFIVARGYSETGAGIYTLRLFTGTAPIDSVGEMSYGDESSGYLAQSNRDRWTFEGTRGDVVTIELSSNDFDTFLSLEFGTSVIASNDDYDGRNSQIGPISLPSDGIYTIVVEGYFSDAFGDYNLSLLVQGDSTIDTSNAEAIAYDDTITGELRGESAVYTFDGSSGDTVIISMSSDEIDSYLELYDVDGVLLEINDDFDGLNAQIGPFELPADGTYTIVATSFGNVSGSFTLTLELTDEPATNVPTDDGGTTIEVDDVVPVGIEVGQRAPNFTLQNLDGETVTLWDLRGQVVLINFWATWCGPCVEEMPALDAVYQEYQSVGFTIVGVDVEESESLVNGFLDQVPVTFPIVLDESGSVADQYNIEFYPTSFILDEEGVIQRILIGSTNVRTLRYELDYIGLERPEGEE